MKPYPEYKDSGLPWVGDIPAHWNIERAKQLFNRLQLPVRPTDDVVTCFRDGMVTLRKNRRTTGFTEAIKEFGYQGVCQGNLVIHAMDAFAGAIGVSDSDGKCTPVYAICQPKRPLNAHYYAHLVREIARTQYILALTRGIRERSSDFRFETFAVLSLPVPPSEEQDAIDAFLRHALAKANRLIRTKRRLIELLQEQKQAIIHQAVTRGLDPDVRLKPSGVEWLGEIPEHWETLRLGNLAASLQTGPFGSQLHADEYVSGGVPVINPSHMFDGIIQSDTACAVSEEKAQSLSRHQLQLGDIVFARRGELGRCVVVTGKEVGYLCGTGSLRMRLKPGIVDKQYLLQLLLSQGIASWLSLQSVGSTMDNLNTGILARMPLPFPPKSEQETIIKHLIVAKCQIAEAIARTQREIELIREYRTRLIADVVTGKLDVRGVALPEGDEAALEDNTEDVGDGDGDESEEAIDADEGD